MRYLACLALAACSAAPLPADTLDAGGDAAVMNVQPEASNGKPWVWYAPSFGQTVGDPNDQWLIAKWAAAGIETKGVDAGESYGSPAGRKVFTDFYEKTVAEGFSTKPCFYVRSRGGLQGYDWLSEHPQAASCIAGIYPVGDLTNYPGLEKAAPAYGMTVEDLQAHLSENNPIDLLAPLVGAGIPIMHLHGDNDMVVPIEVSSQVVHDRYTAMGGEMTLQVIHGQGHDLSPLYFQSEALAGFVVDHLK